VSNLVRSSPRLIADLLVSIMVLAFVLAAPAVAANPVGQLEEDRNLSELSPADQALLDAKLAIADAIEQAQQASESGGDVSPSIVCNPYECGGPGVPETVKLSAYARQQSTCWYCGPASGQVAINYSWNYFYSSTAGGSTSTNKYKQSVIASAMHTNTDGTTGDNVAEGLNSLAKIPSGFIYAHKDNGGSASALYSKLITDVYEYDMVMVLLVRPHEPGASHWLSSWPTAIHAGHFIAAYGYDGYYSSDTPRHAQAYYADSSGTCSGTTGKFHDPVVDVHHVNEQHSGTVVW
jgi:hypothetical protein